MVLACRILWPFLQMKKTFLKNTVAKVSIPALLGSLLVIYLQDSALSWDLFSVMSSTGRSKLSHWPFSLISLHNSDLCWNSYPHPITQTKYTIQQWTELLFSSPAGPPATRPVFGNLWTTWRFSLCHKRGRKILSGKRLSHTKVEEGPFSWKMFLIAALLFTGSEGWQNTAAACWQRQRCFSTQVMCFQSQSFTHTWKTDPSLGHHPGICHYLPLCLFTLLNSKNKRAQTPEILLPLILLWVWLIG